MGWSEEDEKLKLPVRVAGEEFVYWILKGKVVIYKDLELLLVFSRMAMARREKMD